MDTLFSSSVFIHLGAVFYILGFLVRDEMLLRILVMTGNIFYILYYFLFPAEPLWDAILTSALLGAVNIFVLSKIMLERTTFALSDDEKLLYEHFHTLNPGQFRKIMKSAQWTDAESETQICAENQKAEALYFLFSGDAEIKRGAKAFDIQSGCFLGEIAFITDGDYTADVFAKPGSKFVHFDMSSLKKAMRGNQTLSNSMISLFNIDMAKKLTVSNR